MKKTILAATCLIVLSACDVQADSDTQLAGKTEQSMQQANAQLGMPAIVNFQEKRMMKQIYEMRDEQISTQAYVMNEMRGCLVYLGSAVGFGLPYSTQYSNPEKLTDGMHDYIAMPQAEPNGLFMPADAEGTWIMLKDPNGPDVKPVYIEPRVIVSPFRLTAQECKG